MAKVAEDLIMPRARDFRWALRSPSSSHFEIHKKPNGQFCVVLNHALLRGISAEMIQWWFQNFPNLRVTLYDVPNYEGQTIPAYLLWHPIDHHSASLIGATGPGGTSKAGGRILIREAMQFDRYGWRFPVNKVLKIFYCESDGWAMGRAIPVLGNAMVLRIHFRDVFEGGAQIGVHYHYEVVIGLSTENQAARLLNRKLSAQFGPDFFEAWHRHNVIEVGTLENFLAPLFNQRQDLSKLVYAPEMNPVGALPAHVIGYDRSLFEERIAGYQTAKDAYQYQAFQNRSFL